MDTHTNSSTLAESGRHGGGSRTDQMHGSRRKAQTRRRSAERARCCLAAVFVRNHSADRGRKRTSGSAAVILVSNDTTVYVML